MQDLQNTQITIVNDFIAKNMYKVQNKQFSKEDEMRLKAIVLGHLSYRDISGKSLSSEYRGYLTLKAPNHEYIVCKSRQYACRVMKLIIDNNDLLFPYRYELHTDGNERILELQQILGNSKTNYQIPLYDMNINLLIDVLEDMRIFNCGQYEILREQYRTIIDAVYDSSRLIIPYDQALGESLQHFAQSVLETANWFEIHQMPFQFDNTQLYDVCDIVLTLADKALENDKTYKQATTIHSMHVTLENMCHYLNENYNVYYTRKHITDVINDFHYAYDALTTYKHVYAHSAFIIAIDELKRIRDKQIY